ncbi:transposase [Streptomyces cellulosae]
MGSRKRIYNAEFREGAVRIVTETGKPIPEVVEELGVHPGTLHSWVSRAKRNGSPSSDTPVQASAGAGSGGRLREGERAELGRLRAEAREKDKRIRELEMERDVCKRFVALWVK